jgi:hypothetical protein
MSSDDTSAVENWDCPACALLGLDGAEDILSTGAPNPAREHSPAQATQEFKPVNSQAVKLTSSTTSAFKLPGNLQSPRAAKSTDTKLLSSGKNRAVLSNILEADAFRPGEKQKTF